MCSLVSCAFTRCRRYKKKRYTGHRRAPVCSLVSCASTGCRRDKKKKYLHDTASTGVLVRVLRVHGMSKRQEKRHTGHGQALVCSLVSCTSTGYRRDKKKTHRTRASTGVLARVLRVH